MRMLRRSWTYWYSKCMVGCQISVVGKFLPLEKGLKFNHFWGSWNFTTWCLDNPKSHASKLWSRRLHVPNTAMIFGIHACGFDHAQIPIIHFLSWKMTGRRCEELWIWSNSNVVTWLFLTGKFPDKPHRPKRPTQGFGGSETWRFRGCSRGKKIQPIFMEFF